MFSQLIENIRLEARGRRLQRKINREYGRAKMHDDPAYNYDTSKKAIRGDVKDLKDRNHPNRKYGDEVMTDLRHNK
jgi:hypothetical protein